MLSDLLTIIRFQIKRHRKYYQTQLCTYEAVFSSELPFYSSENLDKDNFLYHNTTEIANTSFQVKWRPLRCSSSCNW